MITVPVGITDINCGNHLGNDSLVSLLHEARVAWLRQHGFTELDVAGASLIRGDLAVEYVKESFYGDVLHISISASGISRVRSIYIILLKLTGGANDHHCQAKRACCVMIMR